MIILLSLYSLLILFYGIGWKRIICPRTEKSRELQVSVVIPIRNEEKSIVACLGSLEKQDYPKENIEVIVVNDFSTDRSAAIVSCFENVQLINLSSNAGKKSALTKGIEKASGDFIITTDGDCVVPKTWISSLVNFKEHTQAKMIAAPVKYSSPGSFFEKFQSLDFMAMQGITGASNYWDIANMSNGANLAFEKNVFFEVGGYSGNKHIPSGDDYFLMDKIHRLYPDQVKFLKSKDAIVSTEAMRTVKDFLNQRIRWASKMRGHTDKRMLPIMLLLLIFHLGVFVCLIQGVLFDKHILWQLLAIVSVKAIVDFLFLFGVADFFNQRKTLKAYVPAVLINYFYVLVVGVLSIKGTYEWKGRVLGNE